MDSQIENVLGRGQLVKVHASGATFTKKINPTDLNEKATGDAFAASKRLLPKEALQDVRRVSRDARADLRAASLPFPLFDGVFFIPWEKSQWALERLNAAKAKLAEECEKADALYGDWKIAMRLKLEPLSQWNEADYPPTISQEFYLDFETFNLAAPDGKLRIFAPAQYEQERQKFEKMMADAEAGFRQELRQRFAALVDHMVERLSNPTAVFRDTLVENFQGFMANLPAFMQAVDDGELIALADRAKAALGGATPDLLRTDEEVRQEVADGFAQIQAEFDKGFIDRPVRAVNTDE